MAAITSAGNGNWSSTTPNAPWPSGVVPGNGDTVSTGHNIAIDVNTTVGTSPAGGGTSAITTTGGTITINAGVTLTVRGPITNGNSAWALAAGSVLEFDASQATTPLSQKYAWSWAGFSKGIRVITCSGSSGSHVTIRSNVAGGNAYITATGASDTLWFNCTYTDFVRMGDTTNAFALLSLSSDTTNQVFSFCTFTACSTLLWNNSSPAGGGWSITDCVWASGNYRNLSDGNTLPTPLSLAAARGLIGSATRLVARCVFDERPNLIGSGATYTNCYFHKGLFANASIQNLWGAMSGCFVRQIYDYDLFHGDLTDCYVLKDVWPMTPAVTGTATAGGSRTLTDAGKSWTTNQFASSGGGVSYAVLITGGTGSGQYRQVIGNTATVLTIKTGWLTQPDATSTYSIYHELVANSHFIGPTTVSGQAGTATGGSTTTLANTGKSWVTNQWAGYLVTVTGGTGGGQTGVIQSNTGTVLTVPTWAVAPDATSTYTITVGFTWTGVVAEYNGADPNGDVFLHMGVDYAGYTILNALVLPNSARDNSGTLITTYQESVVRISTLKVRHCTYFTGGQSAAVGENSTGANVNPLNEFLSNLAWCDQPGSYYNSSLGPYVLCTSGTSASTVPNPAGGVNYNGKWNNLTGIAGGGYNCTLANAAGANDVSGDPAFVSPYRNFASWAVTRGSVSATISGQTSDGLGYVKADPTLIASSLLPYVRAGQAPRSATYRNAGHDGVTIGAVEWTPAVPSGDTVTLAAQASAVVSVTGGTPNGAISGASITNNSTA